MGELVNWKPDEIILSCYRLADRYHQNPEEFLRMPLSRLSAHVHYTVKLIQAQNLARKRDDE